MSEYKVTLIQNYTYRPHPEGDHLEVMLPDDARPMLTPRKRWREEVAPGQLIWNAGGGAYLLGGRYLVMIRRCEDAPSNPGKLTVATGLADSAAEWIDPRLLVRELYEEVLILDDEGQLITPSMPEPFTRPDNTLTAMAAELGLKYERQWGTRAIPLMDCMRDTVVVRSLEGRISCRCVLHWDENWRAANIMFPINLPDMTDLSVLTFHDTESVPTEDGRRFLHRDIYLYDLVSDRLQRVKDGQTFDFDALPLTPQAALLVQRLKTK